jgi:multicomponent Na+:H+ antiporter subunit D
VVLVPLPVAIPLLVAALLAATSAWTPRILLDTAAVLTGLVVIGLCATLVVFSAHGNLVYAFGGWQPRRGVVLGILFDVDPLGAGMAALVASIVTGAFVYSWRYFGAVKDLFHVLVLVFLAAMVGFCLSGDLFNMFVFFELMGVAAFVLTGYQIEEQSPLQGALNFAIINTIGALLLLLGLSLLYGRTGALNLAQIGHTLAGRPADGLVVIAFALIVAAFFTKAAIVPFHFWLPDAEAVAPAPICAIFSGAMDALGLYGVARVYWAVFSGVFGGHQDGLRIVLVVFGVVTAVLGAVMTLLQRQLKRLLAFSTLSHVGMFLIGIALLDPLGLAGTAIYVLGHGLVKAALFLCAGILLHHFGNVNEDDLRGRGHRLPFTGVLFGFGGLALAGLPPFLTFVGKGMIENAAGEEGYAWLTAVLLVCSVFTGGAVLRAAGSVFLGWGRRQSSQGQLEATDQQEGGEPESEGSSDRTPGVMFAAALALMVCAFAVTFVPFLPDAAEAAAAHFEDWSSYIAAVLPAAVRAAPPPPLSPAGPDLSMVITGLIGTVGAVAYALLALKVHSVPEWLRRGSDVLIGFHVRWLRAIQSGHVGDYVTWLAFGVVVLSAGFIAVLR